MKRKITLVVVSFLFSLQTFSQSPNWLWARSAGGTYTESGYSIAMDADDNIYVTGVFQSATITFGSTTLTNNAGTGYDIFIVKYDGAGNVIWAYGGGGPGVDYGNSISTDINRNVYVTGTFTSTITFGSTTLTTAGGYDIFIAKFDSSGNVLWAKRAGGTNTDNCYNITTDVNGNAYISGNFSSSTITFGSITLTNSGFNDVFLAKYDSFGNAIWAISDGGYIFTGSRTDQSGNIFLTGTFYGSTITFGSIVLTNADASGNTSDLFIVKYDTAGNIIWAESAGGVDDDGASSIGLDGNANIFITGPFTSSALAFGSSILNCGSTYGDIFVAKYDSSGNPLWGKRAGGSYNQVGNGISTDASGNVYITGMFQSATCSFGSITLINAGSTGDEDIFVAKYDASGNLLWAISAGGVPQDVSSDICSNALGNASITGYFRSTPIYFGSTTLINAGLPTSGDMFVAKLDTFTVITGNDVMENFNNVLFIFPNPATTEVTINFSKAARYDVQLCNTLGEVLEQTQINTATLSLNMSGYAKGIYFVAVRDEAGNKVVKKVVKM